MDPVSFGLATAACVDLLARYMRELSKKISAYKNAEKEVSESLASLHYQCARIKMDVEVLEKLVIDSAERNTELLELHEGRLQALQAKVEVGLRQLTSLKPNDRALKASVRFMYAWKHKRDLSQLRDDLGKWHLEYSPSLYLIARVVGSSVDGLLSTSSKSSEVIGTIKRLKDARSCMSWASQRTTFHAPGPPHARKVALEFSFTYISRNSINRPVVVDSVSTDPDRDGQLVEKDVQDLAFLLTKFDPVHTNLMTCEGVVKVPSSADGSPAFDLLFSFPSELSSPRSLRALLQEMQEHSLNERLRIAISLAKAVICLHAAAFVHKNISPETILIFEGPELSNKAFLVGFEKFRAIDGCSARTGDISWTKGIYRHPNRQGLFPDEDYSMQHDIYSLGVCLLEIGLWTSLIYYSTGQENTHSRIEDAKPSPLFILDPDSQSSGTPRRRARETKMFFIDLAKTRLPSRMGQKYTDIVVTCLTCLENPGFGGQSDLDDRDGTVIGTRFIKQVLLELLVISL